MKRKSAQKLVEDEPPEGVSDESRLVNSDFYKELERAKSQELPPIEELLRAEENSCRGQKN
jgi:hypothetical protein